jgi:hypothetical protein
MGNSTIIARKRSITNAWTLFVPACARNRKGLGCLRGGGLIVLESRRVRSNGVSMDGSCRLYLASDMDAHQRAVK